MRTICIFTGTRAEYGLLKPLADEIAGRPELRLQFLVSGMHLSPEFGMTVKQIEKDGYKPDEKVEMLLSSDSPVGITKSMGLGLIGYADALDRLSPDILVVLGDRFESFCAAAAAMIARTPVAHLHGGEATFGAIDEPIRHSITKMSHLHFTSTEEYRHRVIQLGETPDRVFNVGAIGLDNIKNIPLMSRSAFEEEIGMSLEPASILVTFHPVTLENASAGHQFSQLLMAIDAFPELKIIFTKANADTHGRVINSMIDEYAGRNRHRSVAFTSLGQLRYLSALQHIDAVLGNSSSGLIEAPSFKISTINIGDRQKGRVRAASVIDCSPEAEDIQRALKKALSPDFRSGLKTVENPYYQYGTAKKIREVMECFNLDDILKKSFYDIPGLSDDCVFM